MWFHHLPLIYKFVETKIYGCLRKDAAKAMFKKKVVVFAPKKDDVAINMILAITIQVQPSKVYLHSSSFVFVNMMVFCIAWKG